MGRSPVDPIPTRLHPRLKTDGLPHASGNLDNNCTDHGVAMAISILWSGHLLALVLCIKAAASKFEVSVLYSESCSHDLTDNMSIALYLYSRSVSCRPRLEDTHKALETSSLRT